MGRNVGVDVLRIIAAFMVVGIHTIPLFAGSGTLSDHVNMWLQAVVRSGLPVFFIISGAFLLTSDIKNVFRWYITRLSSILIPFIAYAYIHFSFSMNLGMFDLATARNFIAVLVTSQTSISVHFWFVYVMIGIYLLTPAINAVMNGMSAVMAKRAFLIILIMHGASSNYQMIQYVTHVPNIFMVPDVYIWVLYFICGGLLFKCRCLFSFKEAGLMILFGLLMTAVLTWITPNRFGFTFQQYDVNVTMLIFASGVFLLFSKKSSFFDEIGNQTLNCISYVSKKTYGIYLIHVLVLALMARYMPEINLIVNYYNANIVLTIMCFVSSLFLAAFIDIPLEYVIKKVRKYMS